MEAKIVLSTCSREGEAHRLAETLVHERLAACVNVISGVESVYHWQGSIVKDAEKLLVIKTEAARLPALEKRLGELHSYEVPEFVVLDIETLSEKYGAWLAAAVAPSAPAAGE